MHLDHRAHVFKVRDHFQNPLSLSLISISKVQIKSSGGSWESA
jgi:hypothetical protein